ncbi:MAG: acyl-CoA synthetase, partial [Arenimonas sp.]|nr:acyl-CoA synthetase [Arenimonas sp.]
MHKLKSLCHLALEPSGYNSGFVALSSTGYVSHANFMARVQDWHCFFQGLSGNNFALSLDDAAEFATALLGAWHAKKIITLPGDKLPSTLKQLSAMVDASVGELPSAIAVPAIGFSTATALLNNIDSESLALNIFTSGSTGEPCAIEKKIGQLDAELRALEACFGQIAGDAVIYGTVSHQHIYGLLFRVLWPLASGRVFYTQRLEYPEQIAKQLAGKPSVLISSPALLKRLPDNLDWRAMSQHLSAVFSSGGPLSAESADKVTQLWHKRPIEVFGSSETGGIAWRQSENGSSSWQPLPGVEWRLLDEHLQIRSPHLPNDLWFVTQDRAALRDG